MAIVQNFCPSLFLKLALVLVSQKIQRNCLANLSSMEEDFSMHLPLCGLVTVEFILPTFSGYIDCKQEKGESS